MVLSPTVCERARVTRDRRFDGRFFVAVRTTGIYCRPICPAPTAKTENVEYFLLAAAAVEAGYRPCLRCRPEAAPGSPAWLGTEATTRRALRMIDEGVLDQRSVSDLAARLGVGERHLRRLFVQHLGAAPLSFARTRRIFIAKTLLDQTDLSMTDIAMAAGFGSIRRFNAAMRATYERSPRELRRRPGGKQSGAAGEYVLSVPFRRPYDSKSLLAFFSGRAIPGVEAVNGGLYQRRHLSGQIAIRPSKDQLVVSVRTDTPRVIPDLVRRVRRQFDVEAVPSEIDAVLARDKRLPKGRGVRLPGAFDGFEVAVRAILGQQVTVKGATTIAGRLVERFGDADEFGSLFPQADILADAKLANFGMPAARGRAINELARAVAIGDVVLDETCDLEATKRALRDLPGVGAWTTEYISMRVLGDPDAFPAGDLGLRKALVPGSILSERELREESEAWRPWRAYAALRLWGLDTSTGGG